MKRKIFSVIFASLMMVQSVMADNLGDAIGVWKSLYSNIQGSQYSDGTLTTVSNYSQWESTLNNAHENLLDSITLNIKDFDASIYSLQKIQSYDVAISARGAVSDDFSVVTYYFDYNPNYKMIRAAENRDLYNKLDLEEKQVFTALNNVVNQIKRDCFTEYDKELAIHDYIVSSFVYGPTNTDEIPQEAHSIVGIVTNGNGICEAYANTFQLMCRLAGIDSQIVTGTVNGVGHMWNIVKIEGDYYHVDVTSDDPAPDDTSRKLYNFFNITDEMLSSTHTWEKSDYPECTATKYNYQIYNKYVITSKEDLEKLILNNLQKSQTTFTFRTDGYIIENADEIRSMLSNKGFSKITITGEYGKDGVFNVTLE